MTAISRAYNWLSDGGEMTPDLLADIIRENQPRREEQIKLHLRYRGSKLGVPILTREFPVQNYSKINNKCANDFVGEIVNTKIGYFIGKPISYKYVTLNEDGTVADSVDGDFLLKGFMKRNQMGDLDTETAKMAAICGLGARLCFIDLNGDAALINVPAWETIFISDEIGICDAPYALRYYIVERGSKVYTKVEFMDEEKITYWIREEGTRERPDEVTTLTGTAFILDPMEKENPYFHKMNGCPLIAFPNNEELLGDCEKVLSLIDGYDRTISDVNSEIEQFRLAYFVVRGMVMLPEDLDQLRQTCALSLPTDEGGAEFVTKQMNDVAIQNHLNGLEQNIIRFAQSVRYTDESFGTASGVALKYKMLDLESKCIIMQNKFTKSLYRQMTVLSGYFTKTGIDYDAWNFEFVFVRNFPLNLLDEAQTLATLNGLVSKETALSQMSFVEDPVKEIEKMNAEEQEYKTAEEELLAAAARLKEQTTAPPGRAGQTSPPETERGVGG